MPELLLEFFSEEIPARLQRRAASDLERLVNERLLAAGFLPEGVKAFATPRRLALVATGLPARQPDRRQEKKGPRVGAPQQAIEGFLKSAGLSSLKDCEIREDKKGGYYVAVIDEKGRATADVIADFVPEIARGFPWPKSMRWGDGELRWVRPLHSILCCFDHEVVDVSIDGLKAGDATYGHRFMAPDEIRVRTFEKYEAALRKARVILDADERKTLIAGEAKTLCEAQGLELVEDDALLDEVAGLAEWPVPMIGVFDEKFLALPDEVLRATMRGHQKYFSVRDPKAGRLAAKFVVVANIEAPANAPKDWGKAMRAGYERVLAARLSDAWYLYHQDLKVPLEEYQVRLFDVKFFDGLGSYGNKTRRVSNLAERIARKIGADAAQAGKAALLAKADLASGMVYEFPELQGVMGRYYALEQGHPAAIADAIREHYLPRNSGDCVPNNSTSLAVSLADRIDTLIAFWTRDERPTGSSDPFALRRSTLGLIEIILTASVRLRLYRYFFRAWKYLTVDLAAQSELVAYDFDVKDTNMFFSRVEIGYRQVDEFVGPARAMKMIFAYQLEKFEFQISLVELRRRRNRLGFGVPSISFRDEAKIKEGITESHDLSRVDETLHDLLSFFHDRLKVYLRDSNREGGGHRYDAIDAVLTKADGTLEDDLVLIVRKLEALEAFLKTDDGANLASGFKRAVNILKIEEKNDKRAADPAAVDEKKLAQAEEKALFTALKAAEDKAIHAVVAEKFEDAMAALASLRKPIDAFFDKVTVNADDRALRANRLALLARFRAATATVADLSKLEG